MDLEILVSLCNAVAAGAADDYVNVIKAGVGVDDDIVVTLFYRCCWKNHHGYGASWYRHV